MGTQKIIKSKDRVKKHGEVFTPDWVVKEMCDLVVWDGGAWRFQCGPWVKLMCFWNSDEIEIIGNIHEKD